MSFKTSQITAGSQVVTGGTIVFSYPSNSSAGTFAVYGHKIWIDKFQKLLTSPNDFSVTFGVSNITVTYLGLTAIPSGARLNAQFNIEGPDDRMLTKTLQNPNVNDSILANTVEMNLGSPVIADADGYFVSQNLTSAGVASVNTTVAAAIAAAALVGYADVPRNIVAAWTGTAVLTVTGKDYYGNTMIESSASGTSFVGKKAFKQVTNIAVSSNVTALTVGTGNVLGLPFYLGDASKVLIEMRGTSVLAKKPGKVIISGVISGANMDTPTNMEIYSPVAGNISKLSVISQGTTTTGGNITTNINTVPVVGLTVTVANGAVAGARNTSGAVTAVATTAVAVGDRISIIPGAAFNGSSDFQYILEIDVSSNGQLDGAIVIGDSTKATATTGDVRGSYNPSVAPDGSTAYKLLVESASPKYLGVTQFAG